MPRSSLPGDRHAQVTFGIALLAALGVAFAATPLPRVTPDSASYLTGAERIAESGLFESCVGPITLFAPGYPAALAPLVAAGLDAPEAARIVNVLATLALVLGAGWLARAAGLSPTVSVVAALAVAVSYATLRNGALVWSEPLFCAILVWLLTLALGGGRGLDVRVSARLSGVLLLAWALLLTRHSGVFLLPAIVLAAWLGSSASGRRGARVIAFSAALAAVPALWWARNIRIDGDPFGRRSESRFSVLEIFDQFPNGLTSLALPNAFPVTLRFAIAVPLVAAAVLAWRRAADIPRLRVGVAVLTTATVVYATAVTVAAMRTVVDPIDTRLMSPILVPLTVLVAVGVSSRPTRLEKGLAGFALAVVATMAILAPGVAWRGHGAERTLARIPDDVSCAKWPERYSGDTVRLTTDRW